MNTTKWLIINYACHILRMLLLLLTQNKWTCVCFLLHLFSDNFTSGFVFSCIRNFEPRFFFSNVWPARAEPEIEFWATSDDDNDHGGIRRSLFPVGRSCWNTLFKAGLFMVAEPLHQKIRKRGSARMKTFQEMLPPSRCLLQFAFKGFDMRESHERQKFSAWMRLQFYSFPLA